MDSLLSPRFDTRRKYLLQTSQSHCSFPTVAASALAFNKTSAPTALPLLRALLNMLEVLPNLLSLVDAVENMAIGCRFSMSDKNDHAFVDI
ncbi:unnamed protein product [Closterium sp. NIES-65]|nr:unnamed protein product [Closterium sp. NIES-65]